MVNLPRISIIMPIYNSEKLMNKPIMSVLNQTLKEIELICINDKSTDNSLKILREIQKKDKRLKIINNKINCGPGQSRNYGIKKAKGKYICFVDSDDWLEIDTCELLYKKAEQNNADVVLIKPKLIFQNKTILDKRLLKNNEQENKEIIFKKTIQRKIAWAPWSRMIKRELLEKNNILFPNLYVAEDMDFAYKTIYYANKVCVENKYLYNYFLHEGSLTSYKNSKRRIDNYFESIKLLKQFLEKNNILKKYKNEFIYFKLYNYLATYGVLTNSKETFNKEYYKKIIKKDPLFKLVTILNTKPFDSVIIGSICIKLRIFSFALKFRDMGRFVLGKWGKRNN